MMAGRSGIPRYPEDRCHLSAAKFNLLIATGRVDAKVLGKIFSDCDTLDKKIDFLSAIFLHPPNVQAHEWIEAFAWAWIKCNEISRQDYEFDYPSPEPEIPQDPVPDHH